MSGVQAVWSDGCGSMSLGHAHLAAIVWIKVIPAATVCGAVQSLISARKDSGYKAAACLPDMQHKQGAAYVLMCKLTFSSCLHNIFDSFMFHLHITMYNSQGHQLVAAGTQ